MTLVEFLRARYDDAEQAAKCVRQPYRLYVSSDGRIAEPMRIEDLHGARDGEYATWADGDDRMPNHITNWALIYDPARVLRDVEAKRRIVASFAALDAMPARHTDPGLHLQWNVLRQVVEILASAHDHHPDYREDWRP